MKNTSDVLVIGGGINGVSTAYHLAKQGAKVILLEKEFIASGPTGWSSAIIRQHYSNTVTAKMALHSLRIWQNFADVVGGSAGFTQTGFLIGVGESDVEGLKANIAFQQSLGINTQFVSIDEIYDIEPHLNTTGLGGFAYEPEGGYCDPSTAANSFAQAAQRLGVTIHNGVRATNIQLNNGKVQGVKSTQGFFNAGKVVVAAGPWSLGLLGQLGINLPMVIARIKIGLYQRPDDFDRQRILGDFVTQVYMRPETGRQMLVGSISPDEANDQVSDPDHFNGKVDLDTLADFAERVAQRFPAMDRGHLASSFASLYDITPDWHSILDRVPGFEGLYICAGGSGHGFKLSPATGMMMANLVLHGKGPDDDINLFSFERFAANRLVKGKYEYSIVG